MLRKEEVPPTLHEEQSVFETPLVNDENIHRGLRGHLHGVYDRSVLIEGFHKSGRGELLN